MNRRSMCWVGLLLAAFPGAWAAEPDSLEAKLRGMTAGFPGTVSLYARNLDTGREVAIDADRRVRTASTIKLPIACALAAEVDAKRARWDERLVIRRQDKVSGSGVLASTPDPETLSCRRMTSRSSHRARFASTSAASAQAIGSLMVLAVRTRRSASIATSRPVSRFRAYKETVPGNPAVMPRSFASRESGSAAHAPGKAASNNPTQHIERLFIPIRLQRAAPI